MRNMNRTMTAVAGVLAVSASCALAQDWPQWRGVNRDAKTTGAAKLNDPIIILKLPTFTLPYW